MRRGFVPFSCRNRRRKSRKGKEKRREIRSATGKRTTSGMVGEIGEVPRVRERNAYRGWEAKSEGECVRGVPVLRGTVERYLCDCLSSGRPLFCYNHVSVRLRGHVCRHVAR